MAPLLTGPKAVPFAAVRVRSAAAHQELCAQGSNQSGPAVPAGGFQGTTLSTRLSSTQPDAPHSASQGANSKGESAGKRGNDSTAAQCEMPALWGGIQTRLHLWQLMAALTGQLPCCSVPQVSYKVLTHHSALPIHPAASLHTSTFGLRPYPALQNTLNLTMALSK